MQFTLFPLSFSTGREQSAIEISCLRRRRCGCAVTPPSPPTTTIANTPPPAHLSTAAPFQQPPLTAWKKGNLPAKQKKLNCSSADQTEHSTHTQLWPSSKRALASKKKITAAEAIRCTERTNGTVSLFWSWQSFHDHRAQPQACFSQSSYNS